MRKHSKIVLLLFVAQAFLIAPIFARAITDSDYSMTPEKIYQRIDTITFTFSGTVINYGVTMASRFDRLNDTHTRLRLDVFIITENGNYVTSLTVNLTYAVTFTINGQFYQRTGEVSDQSSFYQTDDLIYSYAVCSVDVPSSFPATVAITFNYTFESDGGEFLVTDTATASHAFLGPVIMAIIVIAIIAGVVVTIVFIVRTAKRRRAERYKARAAMRNAGVQAGVQIPAAAPQGMPPVYGTPVQSAQAGVPANLIGMASPQGTVPPVVPPPAICPTCGGNVVNYKCPSCGGNICRGCGHVSVAGSRFCEKCGKKTFNPLFFANFRNHLSEVNN